MVVVGRAGLMSAAILSSAGMTPIIIRLGQGYHFTSHCHAVTRFVTALVAQLQVTTGNTPVGIIWISFESFPSGCGYCNALPCVCVTELLCGCGAG